MVLAVGLTAIPSIALAQQQQCQLECTWVNQKGEKTKVTRSCHALNVAIVQIWDAQKQEVTRRVRAISRRIASRDSLKYYTTENRHTPCVPKVDMCGALAPCLLCPKSRHRAIHSITSSAAKRMPFGIVMPSALAVLRLTTNSNLVGCFDRQFGWFRALQN